MAMGGWSHRDAGGRWGTPMASTGVGHVLEFPTERGRIAVAEDVVAGIAGAALARCPGVVGTVPRGWREGLAGLLGTESQGRGVEVGSEDGTIVITVHIVVQYGVSMVDVARHVAAQVREAVQRALGETRVRVHVHIAGVRVPGEPGPSPGAGEERRTAPAR